MPCPPAAVAGAVADDGSRGRPADGFALLPAIDVRGGRVVRLVRGDFARETAYADDPAGVAVAFADAGARWLHVVDLDGARDPAARQVGTLESIVAAVGGRIAVEVAGGMRDEDAVIAALRAGAARVAIGTAALRDPSLVRSLVREVGAARVAVALDVRDGRALGNAWAGRTEGVPVLAAVARVTDAGAAILEVTAVDRDGTLAGPDVALLLAVRRATDAAVVASAGIRSAADITAVRRLGCAAAIVGRALYDGTLALADALAATDGRA